METLIRFGNERQDARKVEKSKRETRGIERSLKKKFNVSEVLEKKRLPPVCKYERRKI